MPCTTPRRAGLLTRRPRTSAQWRAYRHPILRYRAEATVKTRMFYTRNNLADLVKEFFVQFKKSAFSPLQGQQHNGAPIAATRSGSAIFPSRTSRSATCWWRRASSTRRCQIALIYQHITHVTDCSEYVSLIPTPLPCRLCGAERRQRIGH